MEVDASSAVEWDVHVAWVGVAVCAAETSAVVNADAGLALADVEVSAERMWQ